MKAADVRGVLERIRRAGEALRARPAARNLDGLCAVLDAWAQPGSAWQQQLVAALPPATGFHPETVRAGLAAGLAPYRGDALRRLVDLELGGVAALEDGRVCGFETTATVLAGAIPMPTLVAAIAPLTLGSPVVFKPASADPVTAALVARSLAAADGVLGEAVAIAELARDAGEALDALLEADCVVANGSDAAVAALAARVPPARRWIPYGHRFSVALVGPGPLDEATADALARDVAFWDQLGCLSPVSVYATAGAAGADAAAEALARALEAAERRWPRGTLPVAAAAQLAEQRAEAEMRAAAGRPVRVLAPRSGSAWTVVREADARVRPAPLHRFVRIHPCQGVAAALEALRPTRRHLAAVALAGFGSSEAEVAEALARLGASRVCAAGQLQTPPLAWPRDNRGVLLPLARRCGRER